MSNFKYMRISLIGRYTVLRIYAKILVNNIPLFSCKTTWFAEGRTLTLTDLDTSRTWTLALQRRRPWAVPNSCEELTILDFFLVTHVKNLLFNTIGEILIGVQEQSPQSCCHILELGNGTTNIILCLFYHGNSTAVKLRIKSPFCYFISPIIENSFLNPYIRMNFRMLRME